MPIDTRYVEYKKELSVYIYAAGTKESACWLIDFRCGDNIRGLMRMTFSGTGSFTLKQVNELGPEKAITLTENEVKKLCRYGKYV